MNNDIDLDEIFEIYKWRVIKKFDVLFAYDVNSSDDRQLFLDYLTVIGNDIKQLIQAEIKYEQKLKSNMVKNRDTIEQIVQHVVEFQNNNLN